MPKPYRVVKFPMEDDTIAVVPSSWMSEDERYCFWPLHTRGSEVKSWVQKQRPPSENWGTYPAVVLARCTVLLRVLRVQLEVRQQNRDVLHELQQLWHEVRVVSERLDEIEPLDRTRAVSQPALSTVPPVLPRLPADNIEELEAAEAAVQDEAVAATLGTGNGWLQKGALEMDCAVCAPRHIDCVRH
ncbi:hypothetical protein HPB49_009625 [Dermacentor silvarum]|uniref:Uncharacterized protein n=1 Tax=Dermacentor silvarum TaxID=543639 RepID=A0ACB8D4A6_DERSI|nr:hypothetical protein HPB49_009625 [Dermacentor silvarum]